MFIFFLKQLYNIFKRSNVYCLLYQYAYRNIYYLFQRSAFLFFALSNLVNFCIVLTDMNLGPFWVPWNHFGDHQTASFWLLWDDVWKKKRLGLLPSITLKTILCMVDLLGNVKVRPTGWSSCYRSLHCRLFSKRKGLINSHVNCSFCPVGGCPSQTNSINKSSMFISNAAPSFFMVKEDEFTTRCPLA